MTKIAFLGLGTMGAGMARRLANAGFDLSVYNRDATKAAPFSGMARIAATPQEAAMSADIVVSMVADDTASRGVWLGEAGVINVLKPGAVCIESSTLSLEWIEQWSHAITAAGASVIDAPVTGSKAQAETGELVFIAGADEAALEAARPALEAMSKAIIHLGPVGSGAKFKLINNFLCGVQVASLAEALAMAGHAGLDLKKTADALTNGAPGSPLVKTVAARMMAEDYTVNFLLRLMAKDLSYATQAGDAVGVDLLLGKAALARFMGAADAGHGDKDIAGVILPIK